MKNKTPIIIIVVIAVIAGIAAFIYKGPTSGSKEKVKIAANLPLTGPVAAWSGEFPNGFRLGIEDACKELGVDQSTFLIDFQDNAGKPAQAASVVQKQLASGFNVYLVGSSEAAKAAVGQVDPLKVPNFIVAFDPFMAAENESRLRIMANSKIEAPLFISYAQQRGAKSVYIIHVNSAYANEEFGKIVQPALEKAGVAVTNEAYEFDNKDYRTIALKAAQANADLIFICGYSFHLRPLISDLRTNGLIKDGKVMGVMDVVDFLHDNTSKAELNGLVFTCPLFDIPGAAPKAAEWRKRFQDKFGHSPSYVPAYAYDNAWAIVKAYKQAGAVTVDSVRAAMPFQGITGDINLDHDGDIVATVAIAQVDGDGNVKAAK
jgi:branched-chain amino acid transport system substrate-binding protein